MNALHSHYRRDRSGISLVEVAVSMLLVGLVLSASMRSFGQSAGSQRVSADVERARLAAHDLCGEILAKPYADPSGTVAFGLESGESFGSNRTNLDDVDDYHGYQDSPLKDRQGTVIPGTTRYNRRAYVYFTNPNELGEVSGTDQGMKMVIVNVELNGYEVATIFGFRANVDTQN